MSGVIETPQIKKPDYELSRKIRELNTDIKYSQTFALGGLALAGGGAAGNYAVISGNHAGLEALAFPSGAFTLGAAVSVGSTRQAISMRKERRGLRKQERHTMAETAEHYRQHQTLYQEQALHDAAEAGVKIEG